MSGHSKWSTIKRKKGALDAARGKIFTKLAREITISARQGGGDPDGNPRLRAALSAAKAANLPKENQERAIKKGTGELEGTIVDEISYEGRGPVGTAFIVETVTDNKNRTAAEVRSVFGKSGGELGGEGSATWMFDRLGVFVLDKSKASEEEIMEVALEAGASDVQEEGEEWVVFCEPSDFSVVDQALQKFEPSDGAIRWITKIENQLELSGEQAISVAKLWAKLDDLDDVQDVICNAIIPDDILGEHGP